MAKAESTADRVVAENASAMDEVVPKATHVVDEVVAEAASIADKVVAEAASTAEEVVAMAASTADSVLAKGMSLPMRPSERGGEGGRPCGRDHGDDRGGRRLCGRGRAGRPWGVSLRTDKALPESGVAGAGRAMRRRVCACERRGGSSCGAVAWPRSLLASVDAAHRYT